MDHTLHSYYFICQLPVVRFAVLDRPLMGSKRPRSDVKFCNFFVRFIEAAAGGSLMDSMRPCDVISQVFKPASQGEGQQLLPVHAAVRRPRRDHQRQVLGASEGGRPRYFC